MPNAWPSLNASWLAPLLGALVVTVVALAVQSWRLAGQRARASANDDARAREQARRDAALLRSSRAVEGEHDAAALLVRKGYEVLERQVQGAWTLLADGEPMTFGLRADYLVAREGRRYVAEVKTGRLAPRLSHGPTRRQLLEYGAAFDVHGVILVDADAATLTHVEIDGAGPFAQTVEAGVSSRLWVAAVAVALCIGVALGVAIAKESAKGSARPSMLGLQ